MQGMGVKWEHVHDNTSTSRWMAIVCIRIRYGYKQPIHMWMHTVRA